VSTDLVTTVRNLPPDPRLRAAVAELLRRELARRSLLEFARFVWPDFETSWHHVVLAKHLDRVLDGKCRRLMIFMPPRHGKSLLTSILLPALFLARYPDKRVIACSYSAELAVELARELYRVLDSDRFRFLFPDWRLGEIKQANNFTIRGHRGAYMCAGVGGGILGRGFNLGIIDDPIKGRAEAGSETVRESTDRWLRNDFSSRADTADAAFVLMHQRWHDDDVAARVLRRMKEPGAAKWDVLELPAIAWEDGRHPDDPRKPGEALWPARFPVAYLNEKRIEDGPYTWSSVWQQRPTPEGGGMFRREWLRYYSRTGAYLEHAGTSVPADGGRRFATVDLAVMKSTASDYTAIGVWMVQAGRLYLLDMVRKRLDGPDIVRLLHSLRERWRLAEIHVEEVAWQIFLIQAAIREGLPIRAVKPLGKKSERAHGALPWFEQGKVLLPNAAEWLDEYVSELTAFTANESHRHDDQVDCTTYATQIAFGQSRSAGLLAVGAAGAWGV